MLLLSLCVTATIYGIVVISSTTNYVGNTRYILVQSAALVIGIVIYVLFTLVDVDIIAERRELLLIFCVLFIAMLRIWGSRAPPATGAGWPSPGCPSTSSRPRSARSSSS